MPPALADALVRLVDALTALVKVATEKAKSAD